MRIAQMQPAPAAPQDPFNGTKCTIALKNSKMYTCACNVFVIDHRQLPSTGQVAVLAEPPGTDMRPCKRQRAWLLSV